MISSHEKRFTRLCLFRSEKDSSEGMLPRPMSLWMGWFFHSAESSLERRKKNFYMMCNGIVEVIVAGYCEGQKCVF